MLLLAYFLTAITPENPRTSTSMGCMRVSTDYILRLMLSSFAPWHQVKPSKSAINGFNNQRSTIRDQPQIQYLVVSYFVWCWRRLCCTNLKLNLRQSRGGCSVWRLWTIAVEEPLIINSHDDSRCVIEGPVVARERPQGSSGTSCWNKYPMTLTYQRSIDEPILERRTKRHKCCTTWSLYM